MVRLRPINASKGQSLVEVVLLGGCISLVAVGGVGLVATALTEQQANMFSAFVTLVPAGGGQNNQGQANGANNNQNGGVNSEGLVTFNATEAMPTKEQLIANNQKLNDLYEALQSGNASMPEVSGMYGNMAETTYTMVDDLIAAAEALEETDPSLASDLRHLALSGKVLAGWQTAVVEEAYAQTHGMGSEEFKAARKRMGDIAKETKQAINGYDAEGIFAEGSANSVYSTAQAAEFAQQWAEAFSQQWAALQADPAIMNRFSPQSKAAITLAAQTIEANSNIYTDTNAIETYDNSEIIEENNTAP